MSEYQNNLITRQELIEKIESVATPIDFEALIAEGILEKKGARYKILDMTRLPQHAQDKIKEFSTDGTVKFSKVTKSFKNLAKKCSELKGS
jgi:hypothetical protein